MIEWFENPMGCNIKVPRGCAHCGADIWASRKFDEKLKVECEMCGRVSAVTLRISAPTPLTRPIRTAIIRLIKHE